MTYWTSTPQPPPPALIGCSNFSDTKKTVVVDEDTNGNGVPYEGAADVTGTTLTPPGASNPQLPRISADGLHVVFVATTPFSRDEGRPSVGWAYDRQITGRGRKGRARQYRLRAGRPPATSRRSWQATIGCSPLELTFSDSAGGERQRLGDRVRVPLRQPVQPTSWRSPGAQQPAAGVLSTRSSWCAAMLRATSPRPTSLRRREPVRRRSGRVLAGSRHQRRRALRDASRHGRGPCFPPRPADCEGPCDVVSRRRHRGTGSRRRAGAARPVGRSRPTRRRCRRVRPVRHRRSRATAGSHSSATATPTCSRREPTRTTNRTSSCASYARSIRRSRRTSTSATFRSATRHRCRRCSSPPTTSVRHPSSSLSLVGANPGDFNILGTTNCAPTLADAAAAPVSGRAGLRDPPPRHAVRRLAELHADGRRHAHRDAAPRDRDAVREPTIPRASRSPRARRLR